MDTLLPSHPASQRPAVASGENARHLMSVIVEDYFQVGAFRKHIEPRHWDRFESRLLHNTQRAIDLLARHNTRATFFVLGWNAEQCPDHVRLIVDAGHEVASGGYHHDNVCDRDRDQFCERLQQAREAIESAARQPVLGYRMAEGWLKPDDLWLLDHLASEAYAYDSSVLARGGTFRHESWRRFAHQQNAEQEFDRRLWEFPPSSLRLPLVDLPIAGGNYFRQIPHTLMKHVIARWDRVQTVPLMLYFHVWELDTEQPEVSAADRLTQLRHYRNLGKLNWVLDDYLSKYRFGSVAEYLAVHDAELWSTRLEARRAECGAWIQNGTASTAPQPNSTVNRAIDPAGASPSQGTSVSIVIPCYNEQQTVPYLAKTLVGLQEHLGPDYDPQFILVDDGSSDRTWELLNERWADESHVRLLRHEQNQGVARAILTGIAAADTHVVCSMDCDCSYDPHLLKEMLPLLTDGVDLVTASPYHADGEVKNVPGWRLLLSRGASALYRLVLGEKLATYTSCFRVYRRESVAGLTIVNGHFLGIAEMLGKLLLAGGNVVEYPATLSVRLFGHSKMKTVRTIVGHLGLLTKLLKLRLAAKKHAASMSTANLHTENLTPKRTKLARKEPVTTSTGV